MPSRFSSLLTQTCQRANSYWHTAARHAADLVYPPQCVFCETELPEWPVDDIALCGECRTKLAPSQQPTCSRCGAGVEQLPPNSVADVVNSPDVAVVDAGGCRHCRGMKLDFTTVVSLSHYRDQLREAVLRMKHPSGEALAMALAKRLAAAREQELKTMRPDLVVPIPMHWLRRLSRGVNSPELLAREIARSLGVRRDERALIRTRGTERQTDVLPEQRSENIRGAFRVAAGRNLVNVRVLLIDDVLTTGATAHEAAKMLRRAGAAEVAVAVLARADMPR